MRYLLIGTYLSLILLFMGAMSVPAEAGCVCRCVNGNMQPICSSTLDIPPICPARVCSVSPSRVEPVPSTALPPSGTTSCRQVQVKNPYTGQYEWKRVCR